MKTQLTDTLTDRDLHRHIAHKIEIPVGTTQIAIEFQYDPQQVGAYKNLLTLTIFDPHGCRGAWHRLVPIQTIAIGIAESTPGFLAGPIEAGTWNISIDVHMALPGEPINYTIDVATSDNPSAAINIPETATVQQSASHVSCGAGWYRGNLHSHTLHSDGAWDVPDLVGWAKSEGLDFVTLTDHNTISGQESITRLSTDRLLTMSGIELTTFYGHALALGIHDWLDWRIGDGYTIADIQHAIEAKQGLFVIAHPKAPGGAICTGCAWQYPDMMPGSAHIVEVWNSTWDSDSNNEDAIQLWYGWLNAGHRLVATAGTDIHRAPRTPLRYGFSVVYAEDLSESAILGAIARGHLYLSDGKVALTFTASTNDGQTAMMGDTLVPSAQMPQFTARAEGSSAGDRLRLIVNGEVQFESATHSTDGSAAAYTWTASPDWQWVTIEVRDMDGALRALSNPIYLS